MNLPEEVLEKILSRLPTKSLVQLRCVCKTWRTLISRPLFVKTHLRRQLELEIPEIGVLYPQKKKKKKKGDLAIDLESDHLGLSIENIVAILDSCHGLLCTVYHFYSDHFSKPLQELILWNPCTGQANRIPSPSFVSYRTYCFCFFYDSDADDYKIIRILTLQTMDRTRIDVFSLKSNKWGRIEDTHASEIASAGSAIYFNGNIHWLAFVNSNQIHKRRSIIAFSVREKKFMEMELPTQTTPVSYLTVLGGRLHVGYLPFLEACERQEYDVCLSSHLMWVRKEYGMKESWKRVTSFPYRVGVDLNGRLPFVLRVLDNGLLLVSDGRKLVLCDSKNNTWKNITSYKQVRHYQKEVSLYIETLVSPCSDQFDPQSMKMRRLS